MLIIFPWMSIAVLGMVFGKQLLNNSETAYSGILNAGLVCIILFPIVRLIGIFGNFQPIDGSHWIDFLNVVKYPPSLVFTLFTLGVNCILLYLFEKFHTKLGKVIIPLIVFGKTALYFYFAHWFLYGAIGSFFFFVITACKLRISPG